jgi:hypothetical protein
MMERAKVGLIMGDVVGFKKKKVKTPEKTGGDEEDVAVMVCGACDSVGFFLSIDGRIFCIKCHSPVLANWNVDEEYPVA